MAMTLYEDNFGHVAKRPRVDYNTNQFERGGHTILLPPQLVEIQLAKKIERARKTQQCVTVHRAEPHISYNL